MSWTYAIGAALALVAAGALYVRLRWRRAPQAYQAMIVVCPAFFVAGALAGAWLMHAVSPAAPIAVRVAVPAAGVPAVPAEPTGSRPLAPPINPDVGRDAAAPAAPTAVSNAGSPDASSSDSELLRNFCANDRDASTRVADFLTAGLNLEIVLKSFPDESPDETVNPSDGTHHAHRSTLVDFCKGYGWQDQFAAFCTEAQSDREIESLTPGEFLKRHKELMRIVRERTGLAPDGFVELPGRTYDPRSTLADICRDAGF